MYWKHYFASSLALVSMAAAQKNYLPINTKCGDNKSCSEMCKDGAFSPQDQAKQDDGGLPQFICADQTRYEYLVATCDGPLNKYGVAPGQIACNLVDGNLGRQRCEKTGKCIFKLQGRGGYAATCKEYKGTASFGTPTSHDAALTEAGC